MYKIVFIQKYFRTLQYKNQRGRLKKKEGKTNKNERPTLNRNKSQKEKENFSLSLEISLTLGSRRIKIITLSPGFGVNLDGAKSHPDEKSPTFRPNFL